ncbi:hypothetical protein [Maricaulis sp.]|uniref:hypothetical protein n=1 Tax=Maricaulis sp. TaxID=1486257 RepID=UPI00261ADD9E|nr:hypothetical protein [Maricaulis sp.]
MSSAYPYKRQYSERDRQMLQVLFEQDGGEQKRRLARLLQPIWSDHRLAVDSVRLDNGPRWVELRYPLAPMLWYCRLKLASGDVEFRFDRSEDAQGFAALAGLDERAGSVALSLEAPEAGASLAKAGQALADSFSSSSHSALVFPEAIKVSDFIDRHLRSLPEAVQGHGPYQLVDLQYELCRVVTEENVLDVLARVDARSRAELGDDDVRVSMDMIHTLVDDCGHRWPPLRPQIERRMDMTQHDPVEDFGTDLLPVLDHPPLDRDDVLGDLGKFGL